MSASPPPSRGGVSAAARCEAGGGFVGTLAIYAGMWLVYHLLCEPLVVPAIAFNVVFAIAVWSFLMAAFTDPGTSACPEWKAWTSERQAAGNEMIGSPPGEEPLEPGRRKGRWSPGAATWCGECQQERPERAHHCKVLKRCVIRMDHYCPWVGNCIGWRNNKFFMQMNLWSCCACVVWLLTLRKPNIVEAVELFVVDSTFLGIAPASAASSAVVIMIVTGCIFGNSIFMACQNVTTVEMAFSGRNPYAMSSPLDNLRQLCGPLFSVRTLLPLPEKHLPVGEAFPVVAPAGGADPQAVGYGTC